MSRNHVLSSIFIFIALVFLLSACGPPPKWLEGPSRFHPLNYENMHVLELNAERDSTAEYQSFYILSEDMPVDSLAYIGHLNISGETDKRIRFDKSFDAIEAKANELGANAGRITLTQTASDKENTEIEVKLYAVSDAQLAQNERLFQRNVIYVFGDTYRDGKTKKFKIDGKETSIDPMNYMVIQNKQNGRTKISIGGLLGSSVSLKGNREREPVFMSLSSFGIRPMMGSRITGRPGMGVSINTGRITRVHQEFARFLAEVMERENVPAR